MQQNFSTHVVETFVQSASRDKENKTKVAPVIPSDKGEQEKEEFMNLNKQIIIIFSLLLMTTSYALGHIMGKDLQNFQYNAELAPVAPIVDGYLDDPAWEIAIPGKMEQDTISGQHWHESADFTGSFAAVWRNGFLYVAIKLTDDQIETRQTKLLREDHLILYLDPHHSGLKEDLYRFDIRMRNETGVLKSPLTRVEWGNDGQTCELSFRLDDIASKGNTIGFCIAYNDVDNGQLQHRITWAPDGYTEEDEFLADLVFTARIEPNKQQKLIQWGHIKSLY